MKRIILLLGVLFLTKATFAVGDDLPRTLAELNRWYVEPPAGSNAATKFLEGIAALKITDVDTNSANLPLIGEGKLPQPDKPVLPEMEAAMAELVQRNQSAFHIFDQAARLQQSRYPIDLNQGYMILLPHLLKMKNAARIMEISSVSHAVAGQGREAGDALLVSLAMARSLESEPVLISQLVRVALVSMTVSGLEQVLNRVVLPAQTLDRLEESFRQSEKLEAAGFGFTRAFVGERMSDLSAFEMSPEQYLTVPDNATPEERERLEAKIKKTLTEDRQYCEATFGQALAVRNQPFPRRLSQDVFSQAAAVATNRNLYLSSVFFAALNNVAPKEAGSLATLRLAQTAIALEKFRFAHANRFPESLGELTPNYMSAVPEDPFDGRSLRYHKVGKGYVLYSISRNLKDDGGKPGNGLEGDILFSVVNPSPSHP
ncbi:MAG: hypothetical protein WBN75_06920 [Verrucomicrobiia bacterium]